MLTDARTASPSTDLEAHAKRVRKLAVRALWQELVTYPKPGLVSLVDCGSHHDMDAATFARSAFALRSYFEAASLAGAAGASFEVLRRLGIEAEQRMLRATQGVNTHRGAIFNIGLLAAAAGAPQDQRTLGAVVREHWGPALAMHCRDPSSHGARAGAKFRTGGALAEAMAGFPSVFDLALPAYRVVLARGGSANQARLQAFFSLMGQLADTNLLHRGGAAGLQLARDLALEFLDQGGVFGSDWLERARAAHRIFCVQGLSPGGSADLLAACVFVHSLEA